MCNLAQGKYLYRPMRLNKHVNAGEKTGSKFNIYPQKTSQTFSNIWYTSKHSKTLIRKDFTYIRTYNACFIRLLNRDLLYYFFLFLLPMKVLI